jgi:biotin synthesis protein BioG
MQFNWLNQQNNSTLILFFNGWGMDANAVSSLTGDGFDLLEINDYSTFNPMPAVQEYEQTILIAWSLGLIAAARSGIKADLAIAINGTLRPIDDKFGIPPAIFQGTIDNWHERGRNKFNRRMCGDRETLAHFNSTPPMRSIEAQRQELIAIRDSVRAAAEPTNIFDVAIISSGDRIVPPTAQNAYWREQKTAIIELNAPHYLFNRWNSWEELIDCAQNR